MNSARFTPPAAPTTPPPADNQEARWRHLTEALIFAAPYGMDECMRILEATGRPFNPDDALRRCKTLGEVILTEYPRQYRLLSCHAANNDPAFRLRYGHLLPKRPPPIARYRADKTPEQREREADELVATL
jgi:hypothetical protein